MPTHSYSESKSLRYVPHIPGKISQFSLLLKIVTSIVNLLLFGCVARRAQAKADQKRKEAKERQDERDRQRREKEQRVKRRKKQHALLSKRTRVGQPVMKHTMQHLLEKIKSQN